MKKLFLSGVLSLGVLLLTGCDEKWNAGGSGQGHFTPLLTLDDTPVNSRAADTQSRAINVSANDLKLTLTHHTGKKYTWNSMVDIDPEQTFPIGTYTLEASYGDKEDEGFDKPHFYGISQKFTIRENLTSTVNVTATFGNSLVTISCTDAFKNYFKDPKVSIKSQLGTVIEYPDYETRPVHVAPGSVAITVTGTKPNDQKASTYPVSSFTALAAHQYNVKIDVNNGNVGAPILEITFDDELNIEPIRIDLSQDLSETPPPTASAYGFDNGGAVSTIAGNAPLNPLEIHMYSLAGFAPKGGLSPSVILETEGKSLIDQDWPRYIDLVKATSEEKHILANLGLREAGIWSNPGTMAVVDLSDVCSHIHYREGLSNETTFKITITDRLAQTTEPISVTVTVEPRTLEISNPSTVYVDQDNLSFDLSSNGPNLKDVTVQYKNQGGIWTTLDLISRGQVSTSNNSGGTIYTSRFAVKGVPEDKPIELRAVVITEEDDKEVLAAEAYATVERTERPFRLIYNENDIFAKRGKLTLVSDEGDVDELAKTAKLEIKVVGSGTFATPEISKKGIDFNLTNLTAGTKYSARVSINGAHSRYIEFTTETAAQLPNSNLEEWNVTEKGDNWERYAFTGWATYNPMTTGNTGTRNHTAYVNRSGTAPSSPAHEGQNAVELRTIGWGSGNSAVGSIDRNNPKYITKGMLYLGKSPTRYDNLEQQTEKGIEFTSRPSSITFWYRYAPYNEADYGGMVVWVKDEDGNIIAEGKPAETLNKREYTPVSVPLKYKDGCKKAASIYVEFSSSDHPDYDTRSTSWFEVPPFANLSNGKFQGSSMFVDEISLTY